MAVVAATYGFHFSQPWWLLACLLAPPMVALAWRNLASLGGRRRLLAAVMRVLVLLLLAGIIARPMVTRKNDQLTVIAVLDRSQSVPPELQSASLAFLNEAVTHKNPRDLLAVVDVAEAAGISQLPSVATDFPQRNTSLSGLASRLSAGIEMALAIAPPDGGLRILLISDGCETAGDLREAARVAAANGIPIDVLPLQYRYGQEVVFRSLVSPSQARIGQTIPLRFVLSSTQRARGQLLLTVNGKAVDLDPQSEAVGVPVELTAGTNVRTVSLPIGQKGMHQYKATFVPDPGQDSLSQNNTASAITFVAGPGEVLVVDSDGKAGQAIAAALLESQMAVRHIQAPDFPEDLHELLEADAIVLAGVECPAFTYRQQEMMCTYVNELGGGLVMVGGPESFGAGGWIGSPLAEILPVDMDPSQKKQLPKGALALIMHACEMPNGNYWGKQVAIAAVNTLSRLDLAGVLDYSWNAGRNWVYPLGPVGDKKAIIAAINQMVMGDMPDFGPPMQAAYEKLSACDAPSKHVIIISDGDPQMPPKDLLAKCRQAGITCTGVAVFPHNPAGTESLQVIAQATGGRFYNVKDPQSLPQIFIKEAQVVRRSLIVEKNFTPEVSFGLSEMIRGLDSLPPLDGYVLTSPKGGLSQLVLSAPENDPLLAAGQSGLGRCVAFTSSADGRWAASWLTWGGFNRFWEQTIRWVSKAAQSSELEVFPDVQGREVVINAESADTGGKPVQYEQISARVIAPDMTSKAVELAQVGPGRFRGQFQSDQGGSYLVNLRYKRAGQSGQSGIVHAAVSVPYAPEFRDLSDNTALLSEVAAISGGRLIAPDPAQAELFDRKGIRFSQAALPLNKPLILVWLGLFLFDVAARRISLDLRAMLGRLAAMMPKLSKARAVRVTLEQLQARRREYLERLAAGKRAPSSSARYEAGTRSDRKTEMPGVSGKPSQPPSGQVQTVQPASLPGEKAAERPQPSHIDQLLAAKRRARGRQSKPDDSPSKGDS